MQLGFTLIDLINHKGEFFIGNTILELFIYNDSSTMQGNDS